MEFSAPFPVYLALRHSHYYSPSVFKKLDICIPDGELMIARTTASGPWHSACHSAVAWLTALALSDDSFAKDFIKHVFCHIKILSFSACFGSTYTKIGTIQRRLAWPLRKDDTQIREAFHIFFTICMEIQKTSNSQSYLEKEEWNWRKQSYLTSGSITKPQLSRQYGTGTKTEI